MAGLYSNQNNGLDTIVNLGVGIYTERERRKAEEAAARAAEARAQEAIMRDQNKTSGPWWKTRPAMIGFGVLAVVLLGVLLMRKRK